MTDYYPTNGLATIELYMDCKYSIIVHEVALSQVQPIPNIEVLCARQFAWAWE